MFAKLKSAALASALAAGLLAAPAAQARDRWHDRGDDDAALAIGAGIIGLAIGAAIASDNDDDRYYRDRRYYDGRYYDRGYPRSYYYRYDGYPRYRDWRRDDRRYWRERRKWERDWRRHERRYYRNGW